MTAVPSPVDHVLVAQALAVCTSARASAPSLIRNREYLQHLATATDTEPYRVPRSIASLSAEDTTAALNMINHELRNIADQKEFLGAITNPLPAPRRNAGAVD